jgi:hypothetical protein
VELHSYNLIINVMMERNKSDEELIQKTDIAISELVYDKDDL